MNWGDPHEKEIYTGVIGVRIGYQYLGLMVRGDQTKKSLGCDRVNRSLGQRKCDTIKVPHFSKAVND